MEKNTYITATSKLHKIEKVLGFKPIIRKSNTFVTLIDLNNSDYEKIKLELLHDQDFKINKYRF